MGKLKSWHKGTVDEDMLKRCKALALKVWPEKAEEAGIDLDDDGDDESEVVDISFWPQYPRRVSLNVGDDTVLDFVPVDGLEACLLALADKAPLDHDEEREADA